MKNLLYISMLFTAVIVCSYCDKLNQNNNEDSLLMVHALFRHGERTTEHFYPKDPNINNTFYPIGRGALTNRGKWQEYNLGKYLRKRYDKFLGDIYTDDIMQIRSTGFLRTRMSALLVAAGLWPPVNSQVWNEDLHWLAIPVDYKPYEDDDLLNPGACARRIQVLSKQFEDADVKKLFISPYADLMKYLEDNSGKPMKTPVDVTELYLILKTEEDTNCTLPEWTKSIYPEPLYKAASNVYYYFNYYPEIRTINAGYFMQKILNDFKMKMENKMTSKIYLYSGHESTLGFMLNVLGVKPHVAPYGSILIFELHKTLKGDHLVKIFYRQGFEETTELKEVIYSGCEKFCTVNNLRELLKDILPTISYKEACVIKN